MWIKPTQADETMTELFIAGGGEVKKKKEN